MLRRLICVLSAMSLLLCLCACDSIKVPFRLEAFTAQLSFESAGTEIKGELTYNSPEDMCFTVTQPENIAGLQFKSSDSLLSVSIEDVAFTPSDEKDSPVYILFEALTELAGNETQIPLKGTYIYELGSSKITLDCENKKIISIDIKSYHFKFE